MSIAWINGGECERNAAAQQLRCIFPRRPKFADGVAIFQRPFSFAVGWRAVITNLFRNVQMIRWHAVITAERGKRSGGTGQVMLADKTDR